MHCLVAFSLQLLQRSVDNYKPGRKLHSCQVELLWNGPAERLSYTLDMSGVDLGSNYNTITRNPTLPGQRKCHCTYTIAKFFNVGLGNMQCADAGFILKINLQNFPSNIPYDS